jgi:hypothetical protein
MQLSKNRIGNVVGRNVVSGTVDRGLFIYGEQDKGLRTRATQTNALSGVFIVLAHSNKNSPWVDISLYARNQNNL